MPSPISSSHESCQQLGHLSLPQLNKYLFQQLVTPVKHHTIIDQGPIPLYCLDVCRLQDLAKCNGIYPLNCTWSYNNIKTYPVMMPAAKKEKHIKHHMVDSEVEEVEVEVKRVQPLKRLFLFPGKNMTFVGRF
ncbi:uncharacterized protein F5891DRAFT_1243752 [Suillus fuscotomentosus]|uniref:Uncharacterized protein n=1 Tax=Suillus fuscotomentosus TaxID=1912939 RepID=A0AAD4DZU8_9AGAM|nr:uncharacterized protein F5891DRAFT_1243752 [Suillus fuscotomentosus]KAG1897144.1 hypothetical protein F5891DRAFT_1243752 [Suillus fuscotomentosus]